MNDEPDGESVAEATTLVGVLQHLADDGYGGQLIAAIGDGGNGVVECSTCNERTDATEFVVDGFQRLEGASDPDDMNLIAWGICPRCGTGGAITVGYGPNATEADAAVLTVLDTEGADDGGAGPDQPG